jgi:hypothetical protein
MTWIDRKIDQFICSIRDSNRLKIPIGPVDDPTYWRWFVIPRNRFLNIYLHNWRHDDAQDLHDHRAANISIILQGFYSEERFLWTPEEGQPLPKTDFIYRPNHSITFRLPSRPHRVILFRFNGKPVSCWSLFIKFPDVREWFFWCPGNTTTGARRVPWQQYVAGHDPTGIGYGQVGKGCDE